MKVPELTAVRAFVLDQLHQELTPQLTYHCIEHTRDDVVPAAVRLAKLQGLADDDTRLLLTGALFHDLGFIEQAQGHERIGARIARQVLPGFGFAEVHIDTVVGIIMATKLPQSPRTLLEELMADADLDVLGRGDFFAKNHALRVELAALGMPMTTAQWYVHQIGFLEQHAYFTDVAKTLRDQGKQQNLAEMRRRLQELDT